MRKLLWVSVFFVLVASFFAASLSKGTITGMPYYLNTFKGMFIPAGGLFNFHDPLSFYYAYQGWVDFLLFFFIFFILAHKVFERVYEEHARALAVVLGIFLSFSLLVFQSMKQISLTHWLWPFGLLLLGLELILWIYRKVKETGHPYLGFFVAVVVIAFLFGVFGYFDLGYWRYIIPGVVFVVIVFTLFWEKHHPLSSGEGEGDATREGKPWKWFGKKKTEETRDSVTASSITTQQPLTQSLQAPALAVPLSGSAIPAASLLGRAQQLHGNLKALVTSYQKIYFSFMYAYVFYGRIASKGNDPNMQQILAYLTSRDITEERMRVSSVMIQKQGDFRSLADLGQALVAALQKNDLPSTSTIMTTLLTSLDTFNTALLQLQRAHLILRMVEDVLSYSDKRVPHFATYVTDVLAFAQTIFRDAQTLYQDIRQGQRVVPEQLPLQQPVLVSSQSPTITVQQPSAAEQIQQTSLQERLRDFFPRLSEGISIFTRLCEAINSVIIQAHYFYYTDFFEKHNQQVLDVLEKQGVTNAKVDFMRNRTLDPSFFQGLPDLMRSLFLVGKKPLRNKEELTELMQGLETLMKHVQSLTPQLVTLKEASLDLYLQWIFYEKGVQRQYVPNLNQALALSPSLQQLIQQMIDLVSALQKVS